MDGSRLLAIGVILVVHSLYAFSQTDEGNTRDDWVFDIRQLGRLLRIALPDFESATFEGKNVTPGWGPVPPD